MRKAGYFFAAFLPFIIAVFIQLIASVFLEGMAALFLAWTGGKDLDIYTLSGMSADLNFTYTLMIVYSLISITLFSLWYYRNCGGFFLPRASRTDKAFSGLQLFGVIAMVPGAQFACSLLMGIIATLIPAWMEQYEKLMETSGLGNTITVPLILYAVILGPICEELIFRGVTMRLARQALPFFLANLMQAALFGAFHMNWMQGCYAFALGLLLGFVCEKGGSIYYSILLHILFNFWGTVISPLFGETEDTVMTIIFILTTAVFSLGIGLTLFILGMRRRKARIGQAVNPSSESMTDAQSPMTL